MHTAPFEGVHETLLDIARRGLLWGVVTNKSRRFTEPLLEALHRLQRVDRTGAVKMKLRTALVTARSAPAHVRAIRSLINWNINVDEAMFLGGFAKGPFLREFEPDFYFDDQTRHVESASAHVPAGHVPHGIANERTN